MKKIIPLILIALLVTCVPVFVSNPQTAPLDGQVYATQIGTTLWGVQRAVAGKSGTIIMSNGQSFLFGYTIRDMWGFVGLNQGSFDALRKAEEVFGGNAVNAKTMAEMTTALSAKGWNVVSPADVPAELKALISAAGEAFASIAGAWTTFIVIPQGVLVPGGVFEGVMKGEIY